jgi:hypothetical protein
MTSFYRAINKDPYEAFPETFNVKNTKNDTEFVKFKAFFDNTIEEIKVITKQLGLERKYRLEEKKRLEQRRRIQACNSDSDYETEYSESDEDDEDQIPNNIWIVKPGEYTNCGHGISVCSTINEIRAIVNSSTSKKHTFMLQRYIDRPLLYNKRKFDIRCYALFTSVNGC